MTKRKIVVNLREVLKQKGYDQKQLAIETNLTERTISELINGKMKRYPKEALEKIADVLEINDVREILTFINDVEDEQA